ncbi:YfeK family protein [Variovorax sp. V116]
MALVLGLAAALAQATPSASEQKLIDTLILRVSKMTTMTFMRNGDEHNAADAAKHMQAKFDHFKDEITTAEDFIDRCASRSEMTGKPYKIKMPNGSMRDANEFLNAELRTLRQGGGSGKPGAG